MKHGFVSLVFFIAYLVGNRSLASEARLEVLGPAGTAVLNSTYRPIIPYHINGLTRDPKIGLDLGFRRQNSSLVDSKTSTTGADFYIYGSIPLFSMSGRARPSGIMVKVSSESSKDIIGYDNFDWEDEKSADHLVADVGFVLAPASWYMFSIQISIDQLKQTNKQRSARDINDEAFERRQVAEKSSNSVYTEYGYRLKLNKTTSAAVVFKPAYYSKSGTHVREENSFISQNTVEEYNESSYSQGFFSFGFKTRASSTITMMLGIERLFEVKNRNESGEFLEEESTNLGLAAEYRIAKKNDKIWIPRLGFEGKTTGESQFSFGLSMQMEPYEFDLAAMSIQGTGQDSKKSGFQLIIGLGYLIQAEDAEDQEA